MDVVDETEALQRFFEGKDSRLFFSHPYYLHLEVGESVKLFHPPG